VRRLLPTRSAEPRDAGMALMLVMGYGTVLMLVMALFGGTVINSMKGARRETDYYAALAAAQAGVDDYVSRLNVNNTYWQSVDCTNVAMRRPLPGASPACGWSASTSTGWVPVVGAKEPDGTPCSVVPTPVNCARFHYDVDATATISTGSITLTSTGKSRNVERRVRVVVQRRGFTDFLYYSDIESTDPANTYVYDGLGDLTSTQAASACSMHYWNTPTRNSFCRDIQFVTGDRIDGPLHSNDAIMLSGSPSFNGAATTSYPACAPDGTGVPKPVATCYRATGSPVPTPSFARSLGYLGLIDLPPTNTSLKTQTVAATAVGTPGCLYTGPTRVKLIGNGLMQVWSPYTLSGTAACGGPSPNGSASLAVPADNVIYVQNLPATQTSPKAGVTCGVNALLGITSTPSVDLNVTKYSCRAGNLWVSGSLSGRVTMSADNNIYLVDDLTYANGPNGTDGLGLIANNSVQIYHPLQCVVNTDCSRLNVNDLLPNRGTITVHAAILSLNHSFGVELYNLGQPLGDLQVFGSISQKYRGAVGSAGSVGGVAWRTGYLKDYSYDTRLRYAPPPYFLNPVQTAFGQATFAEIPVTP
jgi:hypothetical protein